MIVSRHLAVAVLMAGGVAICGCARMGYSPQTGIPDWAMHQSAVTDDVKAKPRGRRTARSTTAGVGDGSVSSRSTHPNYLTPEWYQRNDAAEERLRRSSKICANC